MPAQITKWGNSLAVRLPRRVAEEAKLKQGDTLDIVVAGTGKLELRARKVRVTLAALLDRITPENLHDASDWGAPVGKEIW